MDSREILLRCPRRPVLGDRLSLPAGRSGARELQFGTLRQMVRATTVGARSPAVLNQDADRHDIAFPPGTRLNTANPGRPALKVGPLIGVLTAGHLSTGRVNRRSPFSYQSYLVRHLGDVARRRRAFLFGFEPSGIDWEKRRITGWTWSGSRWVEVRTPFPDVVYNRVPNRRLEALPGVQQALAGLRRNAVPLFNPRFIDKSQLYDCLRADQNVSRYLPETTPLRDGDQVLAALAGDPIVYLKPRFGSLGNGIVRIERAGSDTARIRFRQNGKNRSRVVSLRGLSALVAGLKARRDYVCQQGISLPLYHGRPFDVRILTQKDGAGQWRLTGMGVRVAGEGSITTHVPSGGRIAPIDSVLGTVFGSEAPRVTGALKSAIAAIAPAIERGFGQEYGEFSMDLGVDQCGRVWFFEANSKPHKFDEDAIRHLSWERTVEYASYLGGFPRLDR